MSAAAKALRYLLMQNAALAAAVPADRIVTGRLETGAKLPAVSVAHISTAWRPTVKRGATQFGTSRVQLTIFAKSYPEQDAVQKLARAALPPARGSINGVDVDSIQPGGDGPDFRDDDADIYMGTCDFIVTFNE